MTCIVLACQIACKANQICQLFSILGYSEGCFIAKGRHFICEHLPAFDSSKLTDATLSQVNVSANYNGAERKAVKSTNPSLSLLVRLEFLSTEDSKHHHIFYGQTTTTAVIEWQLSNRAWPLPRRAANETDAAIDALAVVIIDRSLPEAGKPSRRQNRHSNRHDNARRELRQPRSLLARTGLT